MSKRRRGTKADIYSVSSTLILLGAGSLWLGFTSKNSNSLNYVIVGFILAIVGIAVFAVYSVLERRKFAAMRIADVDTMTGSEFEEYVAKLLRHQQFSVTRIGGAGDLGVDLVARAADCSYAVQVKRYTGGVSRRAISDAVAGKQHYKCESAMVITNSYFTQGAKDLAQSTQCELVDRETLADWITDFRAANDRDA